jgi:hypothetical protein
MHANMPASLAFKARPPDRLDAIRNGILERAAYRQLGSRSWPFIGFPMDRLQLRGRLLNNFEAVSII